ncbi:hypothetical protein Desor_4210 [Desulfosporosinus orientis DSM 765]|uniref:Uncharacterized protein n=1 Tax=Desulfosporosinus orientis (strain ATCC 19365 / DSM 765 / NCIMB 8382 / VKM B-1628 / Singapore I) TaxID=768706 RepID=G7WHT4_DESOD|nr:hypothetical protein Desor_4210 [Desulfosporosinus orientis DSM 765]
MPLLLSEKQQSIVLLEILDHDVLSSGDGFQDALHF